MAKAKKLRRVQTCWAIINRTNRGRRQFVSYFGTKGWSSDELPVWDKKSEAAYCADGEGDRVVKVRVTMEEV